MSQRKTVVITGANAGIGLATAKALAAKGYDIITLCRDKSKGEQTIAALMQTNPTIHAENFTADLSDFAAVQKAATAIADKYAVIDRLINNAGYYPAAIEYDGDIEKTLKASHLGHMLLTLVLMPSLERSPEARIINVSSGLHAVGSFARFFKRTEKITPVQAYADAKLANILFTMALSKQLPPHISTFALHPGVVQTNFGKNTSGWFTTFINIFRPFFIGPEQGAATSVYLADVDIQSLKTYNALYFAKKKPKKIKHADVTPQNAASLWNKSMKILNPYVS